MNKRMKKKREDQKKREEGKILKDFCKSIRKITERRVFSFSSVPTGNTLLDEKLDGMRKSLQDFVGPEYDINLDEPFRSSIILDFHDHPIVGHVNKKAPVHLDIKIVKNRNEDDKS